MSIPAATVEAAKRRTFSDLLQEGNGPLSDAPVDTTSTAQVEKEVSPPGERRNKTQVYLSEVGNSGGFLKWIRENSGSSIVVQLKGEYLMPVPETADGFRDTAL
jgi:hypothetical protein